MQTQQNTNDLEADLQAFFLRHPAVEAAYLFGSQAKGSATPTSDVDVAVLFGDTFDLDAHPMLRLEMLVELEAHLNTSVDLVILNQASLVLCNQVLKYGRLVFERSHRKRVTFEVRSRQAYFDFKPMLDMLHAKLSQQIREEDLERRYRGNRDPISEARRAFERLERTKADHT